MQKRWLIMKKLLLILIFLFISLLVVSFVSAQRGIPIVPLQIPQEEPVDRVVVPIQPDTPILKPETVSKIPTETIRKVPSKIGEKCQIDEDRADEFSKGQIGHWIVPDVDVPPAEIGKWGKVEIQFAPVDYEWDIEDKCISKVKVLDYYCIMKADPDCIGEMGVKQLGAGGAINAKQVEELKDAYCVLDPFSKETGYIGSLETECACGCSDGRCLDEIDTDYDNIFDCIDDDDDNDGVIDVKDNCPLIKNGNQSDVDKDYKGDVCDNCPHRQNKDQADIDEDGVGDACDNCKNHKNKDQKDSNGNYVGDACDCQDMIKGPNEYDVDCGLICPLCLEDDCRSDPNWCGDELIPIRVKGKYNQGFIDVVFVPDFRYTSNEQFKQDAIELVQKGFAKLQAKSNLPINPNYFDKFNFYYYEGGFLDGTHHYDYTADATFDCTGFPPSNIAGFGLGGKVAPFHDNLVIICPNGTANCGGCSELGPGINHKLRTRAGLPNLLVHEASHGVFSLQDEYCGDTFYSKTSAMPNIFYNYDLCEVARKSAAWKDGRCRKICEQGKDWTLSN
ncbi:thrombospondin type 3 repeat-containing protein, partial [Candidatus Woesearchaeota archaeon]|nr:thrombospondin type 3 repeat-containing protein [Candidatus Woesearchaeota archaeon]